MFFASLRVLVLQVLLAPVMRVAAARRARRLAVLEARARVLLALVRPQPGRLVALPPGLSLPEALVQVQALRAGVVPQELVPVLPILLRGFPRNTASSAGPTARRSTSKRRRRR